MAVRPINSRPRRLGRHPGRLALAALLLVVALAWPLLEIGPRGPLLVDFTSSHGIDARDLFALIPLTLAVVIVVSHWRERRKDAESTPAR